MKSKTIGLALLVSLGAAAGAFGQGLMNIGASEEFDEIPFTTTLGVGLGWDSNMASSSFDETDSWYYQALADLAYGSGNRRTQYNLGISGGITYYDNPAPGVDDTYYNARVEFNVRHRASERLTFTDNFYFAYEFEPNFAIGASASRRTDQYLYFYNKLGASYAWSRRFSTVVDWTISGIKYDDSGPDSDDRLTNIFGLQGRYALSKITTLTGEYRFQYTDYDNINADFDAHYVLAGIDHSFNRTWSGSLRAGAEFRHYDDRGNRNAPYVEASLNNRVSRQTTFRWYNRLGLESNEIYSYDDTWGYRTGITATHQFYQDLSGQLGAHYVYRKWEDSPTAPDFDENQFSVTAGLTYQIWNNWSAYGKYMFYTIDSENDLREYDRHRVTFGVTATF